jgi:hypothetical protein
MPTQLTTETATITTATIQIQTLTIGRKQVTLAVFRQLREEPLIAEDGTLNGVPWGIVNYHPERCASPAHWHVVWQQGNELLRARVDHQGPAGKFWSKTGDAFVSAHVREVLEGRGRHLGGTMPPFNASGCATLNNAAPFPVELSHDDALSSAIYAWRSLQSALEAEAKNPGTSYSSDTDRKQLARYLEQLGSAAPEPREVDELYAVLKADIAQEVERRQRHEKTRKALAELPQLFIAV